MSANSVINNTHLKKTCQQINPIPWNKLQVTPNSPYYIGEILAYSIGKKKVLDVIIYFCLLYAGKIVYVTQETIAKRTGLARETVNRIIDYLCQRKMIAKKNNGANKSCWYKLSTIFNNLDVINTLKATLFNLKFHLAISALASPIQADVTRCINVFNFIYKTNTTSRHKEQITYFRERDVIQTTLRRGEMLKKIVEELKLGRYEETQLEIFHEKILRSAYVAYKNTPEVYSPFKFILGACRKIKANSVNKDVKNESSGLGSVNKKVVEEIPCPPGVWISKSPEENMQRFADWYSIWGEKYAVRMQQSKDRERNRFVEGLRNLFADPEAIERWHKNALEYQQFGYIEHLNKVVDDQEKKSPKWDDRAVGLTKTSENSPIVDYGNDFDFEEIF